MPDTSSRSIGNVFSLSGSDSPAILISPSFPRRVQNWIPFLNPRCRINIHFHPTIFGSIFKDYAAKHRAAGNGFGFGLVTGKDTSRTLKARYYKDGSEILISQGPKNSPTQADARVNVQDLWAIPRISKFPSPDCQAYRQFGNSVVVPVVEKVAKAVVEVLQRPPDGVRTATLEELLQQFKKQAKRKKS